MTEEIKVTESTLLDNARIVNGIKMLEEEIEVKETLSPSRIKTLGDCEAKYYFRYVEGKKVPPTIALSLGSSYDDALTNNYEYKINNPGKGDMPVSDVIDAFITSYNRRLPDTEFLPGEDPDEIKNIGIGLVKEYQEDIAPDIIPVGAQIKYEINFPNVEWTLIGIADLKTKDGSIEDNKTTKKSPSKDNMGIYILDPDHHFQVLTYGISEKMLHGMDSGNKLRIRYAVKTKVPKIITVEAPAPTEDDIRYFQNITALTYNKIKLLQNDSLRPIPKRNSMLCTKRFCGYWAMCISRYGGQVKD